jgi:hypothetical protein
VSGVGGQRARGLPVTVSARKTDPVAHTQSSGGRGVALPGRMAAMKPLPFPVRIAAGLVAIAVEQARDLPRVVLEFPVTAVSQALQASMRVKQKVTDLAIKGDRLLGTLLPVEEQPSSATFDKDEPPSQNGASTITEPRPVSIPTTEPRDEPRVDLPETGAVVDARPVPPEAEDVPAAVIDESAAEEVIADATATPADSPKTDPVLDDLPPVLPEVEDVPADAVTDEVRAEEVIAQATAAPVSPSELPALSGYAEMSIAELRSKLDFLELDALQTLLAWEMAHGERPPFVTMLTNQITAILEE